MAICYIRDRYGTLRFVKQYPKYQPRMSWRYEGGLTILNAYKLWNSSYSTDCTESGNKQIEVLKELIPHENDSLLWYDAVDSLPDSLRAVYSTPWWWQQYAPLKRRSTSISLLAVISWKAVCYLHTLLRENLNLNLNVLIMLYADSDETDVRTRRLS
jgi:hypothetical protein